ncbi:hypothetical protein ACGH2B_24585 [Streptomyces sp. BBFR2]
MQSATDQLEQWIPDRRTAVSGIDALRTPYRVEARDFGAGAR